MRFILIFFLLLPGQALAAHHEQAEEQIPDITAFLMEEAREVALAKSAAPTTISDNATILVLRERGYEAVSEGTNGFYCMVVRSWGGPMYPSQNSNLYDVEAVVPECIDAVGVEVIWPLQVFRTELALDKTPVDEFVEKTKQAFVSGHLKRIKGFALSYMLSNEMILAKDFPGPPHVMFYMPDNYTREMSGGLGWLDQVVYHEGGSDQPYTALMIMRDGIDPAFLDE